MTFDRQPTLHGPRLRLEPLREQDFEALFAAAADPLLWEQHPAHDRYLPGPFRAFFDAALASGGALVVRDASGAVIGTSRYDRLDEKAAIVEIGYTFLARSHWGDGTNAELKALMLAHAFESLDTVEFRVAPENFRSQQAVRKLGADELGERVDDGVRWVVFQLARGVWQEGRGSGRLGGGTSTQEDTMSSENTGTQGNGTQTSDNQQGPSERLANAEAVFERLFGPRDASAPDRDPEFGEILRRLIFGDVFATGQLDDRTRELVTVTCLACLQTLPQLKAHSNAALNVGVEPVQLREAMYQLAPFIGFPRTLNAIGVVDEVLTAHGVELPLPNQGTTTDEDRHAKGLEIQKGLYGTEIADALVGLPEPYAAAVPGFLTDFLFGDFWTRGGLDVATRELLGLVTLAALGLAPQLPAHVRGCLAAGNSIETVLAVLVQAFPYIGYPAALNAIRVVLAEVTSQA